MDTRVLEYATCLVLNSFFLRVDKKRDKIERKILDSQERAFWDVHRPVVSEITDAAVTVLFAVTDIIADIIILIIPTKVNNTEKNNYIDTVNHLHPGLF